MKLFKIQSLLILSLLMLSSRMAEASLMLPDDCENPLVRTFLKFKVEGHYYDGNDGKRDIDFTALNKKLKKQGLEEFPSEVTVGMKSGKEWKAKYEKSIEAAEKILKTNLHINIDRLYLYEAPEICYFGSATAVADLIVKLGDTFFHGDQGILGYRVGTKRKALVEDEYGFSSNRERTRKNYEENGYESLVDEFWTDEPGSRNVFVYSNLGPQGDGTELYSTRIKPCPSI